MFKSRLWPAVIAAGSLLFMAFSPAMEFMLPQKKQIVAVTNPADSLLNCEPMHAFDSSGLCTCLSHYSPAALVTAPRISLHHSLLSFVQQFDAREGYYLDKTVARNKAVLATIDAVFEEYQLPVELKYLAIIESNLDKRTTSNVGAVGIWQLMPDAARTFGLKVVAGRDDRKNNYKSSVAAARCLQYLHGLFDDWLLTLAAYNCGPGRVQSAIRKSGSRDYWSLQSFLPAETRAHVKKFIAIHYYVEGHGSLVTMTKKETQAHIDAVATFVKAYEIKKDDTLLAAASLVSPVSR